MKKITWALLILTLMSLGVLGVWLLCSMRSKEYVLPSLTRLLPLSLWKNHRPKLTPASNCLELPMPEDLQFAADSWQLLELAKGNMYLYAAYWDTRYSPQVTVLVYSDFTPLPQLYCLLWHENSTKPSTVLASFTYGWRSEWGGGPIDGVNEPYLVSCKVHRRHRHKPAAVSIVTAFCLKSTNILSVQSLKEERAFRTAAVPSIGVCLKWLRYNKDISAELIEWIEILKAFGADIIYVYVIKVHPNTERVLNYYSSRGVIDVTPFTLPPERRSTNFSVEDREFHKLRQELLPLNDCLYRAVSSGKHQWLTNLDLDEIIVPIRDITWQKLVGQESQVAALEYGAVDALAFLNYFFLGIAQRNLAAPPPARILAQVWRAKDPNPPENFAKCFHNVSSVIAAHNHYPSRCMNECSWHVVPGITARLHHYIPTCPGDRADCLEMHNVQRDDVLARLHPITLQVRNVLIELEIPFNDQRY